IPPGQLAIQACVAAGVNITYKILFNQVVAMTGAQDPQGALEVPALTRKLQAEGVKQIIVCAEEPDRYGRPGGVAPGWRRASGASWPCAGSPPSSPPSSARPRRGGCASGAGSRPAPPGSS